MSVNNAKLVEYNNQNTNLIWKTLYVSFFFLNFPDDKSKGIYLYGSTYHDL